MSAGTFATTRGRWWLTLHTLGVFVFLYAPLVMLIVFSFNKARQTAVWEGFTLEWYAKLLGNADIRAAIIKSLRIAAMTTLAATLIGVPAGVALGRYAFRGKLATQVLIYLPLVIPEIVFAAAALTFFGAAGLRLGETTVVLAHVVFSVPYVALIVRARMAGMDPALQEAAADLGAPPLAAFFRVTLPLIMPAVIAGALLSFTISLDDYLIAAFVSGVGTTTLPLRIYSMVKIGITPEINAVSTVMLVGTTLLMLIAQRLLDRRPRRNKTL